MASERTLVLVKPDGVQRGLIGEVIGRIERRGLRLCALKLVQIDEATAARHYAEHVGKPFYESLMRFITSGPVVAMVWEGPGAVGLVRSSMGATDPAKAAPGTIRGDLATSIGNNVVHGGNSRGGGRWRSASFSATMSWLTGRARFADGPPGRSEGARSRSAGGTAFRSPLTAASSRRMRRPRGRAPRAIPIAAAPGVGAAVVTNVGPAPGHRSC